MADRPRVLHIAGYSRTGSTLVGRVLAQLPGFVAVGEFSAFWASVRDPEQLCGCGTAVRSCPFWSEVLTRALGGVENLNLARYTGLQEEFLDRPSRLERGRLKGERRRKGYVEYVDVVRRIYEAVVAVSGCKVIVDATKIPHFSHILRKTEAFDVRVLHLVRDSRAVVHSWRRPKRRSDTQSGTATMPEKESHVASFGYDLANLETHLMGLLGLPYRRVRYEDFTRDPLRVTRELVEFIGEPGANLDFVRDHGVHLSVQSHTVWGNPDRTQMGDVSIREDDEWRAKLPAKDRGVATALTLPLLLAYGYVGPFAKR